jgi:orotate phosphoribosyltransferase-like protein
MIPYNTKIRQKAIELRKKGVSYGQIAEKLGLGKSTVGFWFKNVIGKSKTKPVKPTAKKVQTKQKKNKTSHKKKK